MQILIDADGCPVVDLTIRIAREQGIPVTLVCDTAHVLHKSGATTITVSQGADAADYYLLNQVSAGDIVITQDYGLAAMALAKSAHALNQDGLLYTSDNIDALLQARHTARKIRKAGGRLRGPKKRNAQNDSLFETALRTLLKTTT